MDTSRRYRPSQFTVATQHGDNVILYNALQGTVSYLRPPYAERAHQLLRNRAVEITVGDGALDQHGDQHGDQDEHELARQLVARGHLVPSDHDEGAAAGALRDARLHRDDVLELILMPTESCNFRCAYCYEDFKTTGMLAEVREGVRNLVRRRCEEGISSLRVAWFGGEPLVSFDVIEELSTYFLEVTGQHGVAYSSSMTTNGYLLTDDIATRCLALGVRKYQITLDGPKHVHDLSRPLMGGGGSFEDIMAGVRGLAAREDEFQVQLRVNFSERNVGNVPELVEELSDIAAGDSRFQILFRAVGHWGGPQDATVGICSGKDAELIKLGFYSDASGRDMRADDIVEMLKPGNAVCYAANPWSMLIRPDGTVGKCTVALRDERNNVGRIQPDGELKLDDALMRLWTESDEKHDKTCQSCFYRPACQGAHCPLIRIQDGERPCPSQKVWIGPNLRTVLDTRRTAAGRG